MSNHARWIVVLWLLLVSTPSKAQFKMIETNDFKLVYYDFGHEYLINHTIRSYTNALRYHEKRFGYRRSDPVTIVMEDFGDYGNAGASSVPRNIVMMGIAPFKHAYETNATNERINVLANHELVHIVALDMANTKDRAWRSVFRGKVDPVQAEPISMFYGYLTAPRRYSPRWYHEGIAEFMTTWMAGGIGRVMGSYDEMRFRTMVRDNYPMYDAIGLESEGTTVDFEVGANSYMYGTRFMSYLAHEYGPEKLIEWVARTDSSKRYYASQFRNVYGKSLDHSWSDWIAWERDWQNANLERIRKNPVTPVRRLTERPLGGVSRPVYDPSTGNFYAGIAYPGALAHIAEINPRTGSTQAVVEIEGPALHFVTSLTIDPEQRILYYTNDNNKWRDLMSFDLGTRKVTRLIKDARVGDLVFNPVDKSLWGVRHLNGISSLVRIPQPYSQWNLLHAMPYGEELFDIDISPDGSRLSAAVTDVAGNKKLLVISTDSLMARKYRPQVLGEFAESSPASFVFSEDGNFLYGSTYYTGVSNIVRYDLQNQKLEWLTNAETGMFRPVPIQGDSLVAFEYTAEGFLPVVMAEKPITSVGAIEYLGNAIAIKHSAVTRWGAPLPPVSRLHADSLIVSRGMYDPMREMSPSGIYPIVQGYKNSVAIGLRGDFMDPVRMRKLNVSLSYSPDAAVPADERIHAAVNFDRLNWSIFGNYNGADFYDLFGPTKTSRKGYSIGTRYKKSLRYEPPRLSDLTGSAVYYGNLERLPEFQNVTTSFSNFLSLAGSFNYQKSMHSLGAVDSEKGFKWQIGFQNNAVLEGIGDQRVMFPRVYQNFDIGTPLPINHSSFWLRTSTGISFSPKREPLGNFYLGGFGNNWVDHLPQRRYRTMASFPGVELNAIGGTNYAKVMGEWVLPPIRFKRLGIMSLYSNWSQLSLFTSGLVTNIGSPVYRYGAATSQLPGSPLARTREQHKFYNIGAQLDFKLVLFSVLDGTLSFGYANAFDLDMGNKHTDEFMVSLKLLR